MSTHTPRHTDGTRPRRAPRRWASATVPMDLTDQLGRFADARDQLAAIAMYHFRDLVRQVGWQVGDAKAEDLVQDVILRHLGRHDTDPQPQYTSVNAYHKLRSSLITSTKNAAIDHLRRTATRAEMPVGTFGGDRVDTVVGRAGGVLTSDVCDDLVRDLDSSALHDGLRRVDGRHAQLLRMKLNGATFSDIATHMEVSTTTAYKAYQRAMRSVQPVLERYGAGGFCNEYGPYLMIARQEHDRADDPSGEQPLTDMIGIERALELRLHVYGDPDVDSDEGCVACRHAGAQHGAALVMYLPAPLLLMPATGVIAVAKGAAASVWSSVTGWFSGLLGGSAASGVAAKGVGVVIAAAVAIGGTITVNHVADGHVAPARGAKGLTAAPAVTIAGQPKPVTPPPIPARTSSRRSTPATSTARSGSPASGLTPTPQPRTGADRPRSGGHGNPAAEFTP